MARRCEKCKVDYYTFRMEDPLSQKLKWCPECLFREYLKLKKENARLRKKIEEPPDPVL